MPLRQLVQKLLLISLPLFALSACAAVSGKDASPKKGDVVWLGLMGYNYSDHYIDNYSVNDAGGGGLRVSSPTSGGGGITCCVKWKLGQSLPVTVRVRWQSDACRYIKRVDDEDFPAAKVFYSEKDVELTGPIPNDPRYFETHFYPDGHIEVAVADRVRPPQLRLPRTHDSRRPGVPDLPECTPEQMKTGQ